jgi:penicillin-binding protein 1B
LGSISLTPLEVARMYQTFAAGGFDAPSRTVRAVQTRDGETLPEPGLRVRQALDPAATFLVNTALERVAREGTARALDSLLPRRRVAGKTGTTSDLRDSWFAGFDGRRLGVVWIGRDDNGPTGLTGSAGALRVWADMMRGLPAARWQHNAPPGVTWAHVDFQRQRTVPAHCDGAERLPFIEGSAPPDGRGCHPGRGRRSSID